MQVGKPLLAATYGCAEQPQTPRDAVLGLSRHDASRAASVLAHAGCVALWDLSSPKTPVAVLLCESSPTCCVWGPPECSHVVLAGSAVRVSLLHPSHACLLPLTPPLNP